jgi:hypothetical protein
MKPVEPPRHQRVKQSCEDNSDQDTHDRDAGHDGTKPQPILGRHWDILRDQSFQAKVCHLCKVDLSWNDGFDYSANHGSDDKR